MADVSDLGVYGVGDKMVWMIKMYMSWRYSKSKNGNIFAWWRISLLLGYPPAQSFLLEHPPAHVRFL